MSLPVPIPALTHRPSPVAVTLADGRPVHLRPLRAADRDDVAAFYTALTPASRRLRFLQAMPEVPDRLARQMSEVDHDRHVAWAAWRDGRMVGEARYVRLRNTPDAAEVAFAVAEDARRQGLARLLVETVGVIARLEGIGTFTSTVSDENRASSALLRSLGSTFRWDDGAFEGRGPVPPWCRSRDERDAILAAHTELRAQDVAVPMDVAVPLDVAA